MVVPPTALQTLRRELRKRRRAISDAKHPAPQSRPILARLIGQAECVGLYLPMADEPDPFALVEGYAGRLALPATASEGLMTFCLWSAQDCLTASAWGGQQPLKTAPSAIPDVIFVPLLGFDAAFNRIGQGGGHYDRYLAANPGSLRVGFAWEGQRLDQIAPQPWDVPMDAILTEKDFYVKDLSRCLRR